MKLTWKEVLLPNDNLGYALIKETGKPYEVDRHTGEVRVHKEPNVNSLFKCYRNIIISSDEGKIYLSSKFFPDDNFRRILAVKLNILENDEITEETIKRLTYLDVNNQGIEDLTGLENFVNLQTLHCSNNYISELDISKNTNLITLDIGNNPLRILTNSIDNDKLYYINVESTIIENIQTFINNLPTWPESEEENALFGYTYGLLNQEQINILENKGWDVNEELIERSSYYLELHNDNYHINAELTSGLDISDSNAVFITIISLSDETGCVNADSEFVNLTTSLDDLKNGFDFSEYITQGKSYGIHDVHRDEEFFDYELMFEYPCEEPVEHISEGIITISNGYLKVELIIYDEEYTEAPETFNIYLQEFNDGAEAYFDPEDNQAGTTMITYTNGESLNRKALPQNHQGFNWYVTSVSPNPIQGVLWMYDDIPLHQEEEEE